jgi:cyclopropane fatty-acyl-phospholipid synthase-like methyltransferase
VDLSAGTGPDCLYLQERGFKVVGVDISPRACEIMEKRGVDEVRCSDLSEFNEHGFDTILLYDNGIGYVETLQGIDQFLKHAKNILNHDGQIIMDSFDMRKSTEPSDLRYIEYLTNEGRYFGEYRYKVIYKGLESPYSGILRIDPEMLKIISKKNDWLCEILIKESNGNYLSRLSLY